VVVRPSAGLRTALRRGCHSSCVKCAVTKVYVLGMTVVLASGRILYLGGKLIKGLTNYQLMRLFVGSAGTLEILTGLILPLPLPRHRAIAA
jgi:glycolate oxidase